MKKRDFWSELETRLEENNQLEQGGIPPIFRPMASFVGLHFWQSLLLGSFMATVVIALFFPEILVHLTEDLLLIW